MKILILLGLFILSLLFGAGASSSIYNCVDCSYNNSKNLGSLIVKNKPLTIVYQKQENIKTLTQNYSCKNCGLFEVSVRENAKTQKSKWQLKE